MQSESGNVCRRILIFKTGGGKQQRWYERINRAGRERRYRAHSLPLNTVCITEHGKRKQKTTPVSTIDIISIICDDSQNLGAQLRGSSNHHKPQQQIKPSSTNQPLLSPPQNCRLKKVCLFTSSTKSRVLTLFIFFASR